jgi:hypothetical protein
MREDGLAGRMLTIASFLALVLLIALSGYETWFCAGALHGDPGGCAEMSAKNLMSEPLRLFAIALAAGGVVLGMRLGRKK